MPTPPGQISKATNVWCQSICWLSLALSLFFLPLVLKGRHENHPVLLFVPVFCAIQGLFLILFVGLPACIVRHYGRRPTSRFGTWLFWIAFSAVAAELICMFGLWRW